MSRFKIIAFSGNLQRPSRTRTLVEAIGIELSRHINADLRVFDLLDAGPAFAGALDRAALPLPAAQSSTLSRPPTRSSWDRPSTMAPTRVYSSTSSTSSSPKRLRANPSHSQPAEVGHATRSSSSTPCARSSASSRHLPFPPPSTPQMPKSSASAKATHTASPIPA